MKNKFFKLLAVSALAIPIAAQAAPLRTTSGSAGSLTWKAQSTIVGQTSTATAAGGGDPIYNPDYSKHSGVVSLIMEYSDGSAFICSGSLLNDRRHIVTAAHCVSDGTSARPVKTTAYFYGGPDADTVTFLSSDSTARRVGQYFVNPAYTGEVIDQNDIAVLRLQNTAPDWAQSYGLYTGDDIGGQEFNIAGYGRRSTAGGSVGADLGVGRLRQGDNEYGFRLGDSDFGGFWDGFFGTADAEHSWISDFDNGDDANDASCILASFFGLSGSKYCGTGVGDREVGVAGGDSGGPQFIDGLLASVTSYGLTFGSDFGDFDDFLNSSWGEFNGFVPIYLHLKFIHDSRIPEPAMFGLLGLGVAGVAAVRRRKTAKA